MSLSKGINESIPELNHSDIDNDASPGGVEITTWMLGKSTPMPPHYVNKLSEFVQKLLSDKYKDVTYKMLVGMPNHYMTADQAKLIEDAALVAGANLSAASKGNLLVFTKEAKTVMLELIQAWMTGKDRQPSPEILTIEDTPVKNNEDNSNDGSSSDGSSTVGVKDPKEESSDDESVGDLGGNNDDSKGDESSFEDAYDAGFTQELF